MSFVVQGLQSSSSDLKVAVRISHNCLVLQDGARITSLEMSSMILGFNGRSM